MARKENPYSRLLAGTRLQPTSVHGRDLAEESESDRARLLFSAPFRRLQQKAQVFSLEDNAAVRSRLTHSLEVAQIGRFLAKQVVNGLRGKGDHPPEDAWAFSNFVETACLMHDIGNPPFGHFGESAIAEWFQENGSDCIRRSLRLSRRANIKEVNECLSDFLWFDGNCQGLRIVSKLQWNRDEYGLNLTATSLAAYLKYVVNPLEVDRGDLIRKKAGYFLVDEDVVKSIWRILGMRPNTRHPLAYLMEAADDIAYSISDIEDAIEKGFFSEREFFEFLRNEYSKVKRSPLGPMVEEIVSQEDFKIRSRAFTVFRTRLSRYLSKMASNAYVDNHHLVLKGRAKPLLAKKVGGIEILEILREFANSKIYDAPEVARAEMAGYAAIRGILDKFKCLISCEEERFGFIMRNKKKDGSGRPIVIERKLYAMLPSKHQRAYEHALKNLNRRSPRYFFQEWSLRAHLIVDYISGMTDDFALQTYQNLAGISTSYE